MSAGTTSPPGPEAPPSPDSGTSRVKRGMAEILKGGVIMDVIDAEQAKIAEDAGAVAVMTKARIGHFAEAQILKSLGVDYIDESEVLTPADYANHRRPRRGRRSAAPEGVVPNTWILMGLGPWTYFGLGSESDFVRPR